MPQSAESLHTYYMLAALCLGSIADARSALTEAAVSAGRQNTDILPQLLRICRTRTDEKSIPQQNSDFPSDSPLLDALRLTFPGRRDLGLLLCGITAQNAAAACGVTPDEQAQKTEKALRQFTFLNAGTPPDQDALKVALHALPWTDEDIARISNAVTASAQPQNDTEPEPSSAPEIKQISAKELKRPRSVPMWAFVCMTCAVLVLSAAFVFLYFSRNRLPEVPVIDKAEAQKAIAHEYLSLDDAQNAAKNALPEDAVRPICTNTKLKLEASPAIYEVTVLCDRGLQYVVTMDAKTADIRNVSKSQTTSVLHIEGWISADVMRQQAMQEAGLSDAVFLKEKRGIESDHGYYKYELLSADDRVYTIQMDAITSKLLKYSVEEPIPEQNLSVISVQQAQKQALSRVSELSADKAIFTKTKLDGNVYIVVFSMDDGTQYTVEINAVTGAANTVNVRPVSVDTGSMIGMLRAKDIALDKANLKGYGGVRMTKAKIDRENSAYVYELEFETEDYEYEATLHTATGEILKYRALRK